MSRVNRCWSDSTPWSGTAIGSTTAGARQDMLRQEIVRRMGLSNRPDRPFPHDSVECEELLQTMRRHRVAARHGDLFDPLNFEGDRAASSLGDAMVIELLGRFAAEVEAELGEDNPPSLPAGLREIDCIRPIVLAPVWIDGLLERTCPIPAIRNRVRRIWDRLLEDFLAIDFVRDSGAAAQDWSLGCSDLLRFGRRSPAGWADSIAAWYYRLRGADEESYLAHALAEPDYRNRRAKHIVYGHTHTAQTAPLDASYAESYVLNQVYFNAGTWRRTYPHGPAGPRQNEFIASDEMTWLTFYQGDERTGRPYETWSGMLGAAPTENTVHRIDPGRHPMSRPTAFDPRPSPARAPFCGPANQVRAVVRPSGLANFGGECSLVSHTLADQHVAAIYLVHGVSLDPGADYTESYAYWFESGILASDRPTIPCGSSNGRAKRTIWGAAQAVRLIDEFLALVWNLGQRRSALGASVRRQPVCPDNFPSFGPREGRGAVLSGGGFITVGRSSLLDIPVWNRVRRRLRSGQPPLPGVRLDFVMFGTAARYAWDPAGYSQLLHFVEHSATASPVPDTSHGLFAWRARTAERRLGRVLASLARKRRPACRPRSTPRRRMPRCPTARQRWPSTTTKGLAPFGSTRPAFVRREWILFHAEEVVRRFYAARVVNVA